MMNLVKFLFPIMLMVAAFAGSARAQLDNEGGGTVTSRCKYCDRTVGWTGTQFATCSTATSGGLFGNGPTSCRIVQISGSPSTDCVLGSWGSCSSDSGGGGGGFIP